MRLKEEVLLNRRKMLKPSWCVLWGQVFLITHPLCNFKTQSWEPGWALGLRLVASSPLWTLRQAEMSFYPCWLTTGVAVSQNPSEGLAAGLLELGVE